MYLITSTASEAGTLETLPITEGMTRMTSAEMSALGLQFGVADKVAITSEATIEVLLQHLGDDAKRNAVEQLKDKYKFRTMLTTMYPDYQFSIIDAAEIQHLKVTKKCVIKPVKGCFGTGVRVIDETTDLNVLMADINAEIEKNGSILSESVLTKDQFLIESYIGGEEYAVDMFYDKNGKPHIVNIYHHPMPREEAYLHVIYYTSKAVFEQIYDKAIAFFETLNQTLNVINFLIHSKFRLDNDVLMPIEMNTMRVGGMGLGNMVYHALGVNPYAYFIKDKSPNWADIWANKSDDIYAYFIAYNGKSIDKTRYKPNVEKLVSQFTNVILERTFDYQNQLAFGVFCIKETPENLKKLLDIEFDDYFEEVAPSPSLEHQ
jgi:effector-binding domain-containing protein